MQVKVLGLKRKTVGGLALLLAVATTMLVFFHKDAHSFAKELHAYVTTKTFSKGSNNPKVLLPAGTHFPVEILSQHLQGTSGEKWDLYQLKDSNTLSLPPAETRLFKTRNSYLYELAANPDCKRATPMASFAIDESRQLSLNLTKVFEIYSEERETYKDSYNSRIEPIIKDYLKEKDIEDAWFRYAGSSVWLKNYNVHYVISRLVLSKRKLRNYPTISLLLAQVYDESWNELEDVRMVLPSNKVEGSPGFEIDGQPFISQRFPHVLPIPFEIGEANEYWGAEDPRTLLVKNKNGYEEPVVVYNSLHASQSKEQNKASSPYQRSIFMSYPFQVQKGMKMHTLNGQQSPDEWFSRTKYLSIKGETPQDIEKNWTPFVSGSENFDEHIMFATQLEPLNVIKCELLTDSGECTTEGNHHERAVGALRGGTPLFSLKIDKEEDKEYFIGFARAHLKNCGCGGHFYRPNFIVVLRQGTTWRITHITSSVDLGMKVLPFQDDGNLCSNNNAMIPNGIEFFDQKSDILSLFVSISDFTVERVKVKGVLRFLENVAFWETKENHSEFVSPVSCAMEASKEFCQEYGEKYERKISGRFE